MDKGALRKHFLQRRKALTDQEFDHLNEGIQHQINQISFDDKSLVHIFLPIQKQREVDTWTIHELLTLRYPKMRFATSKSILDKPEMYHFLWDKKTVFRNNSWGIPEPTGGELIQPSVLDVVFVPLLTFDLTGHRVGYGKGYYDRFLEQCNPQVQTIGISLFDPVESIVPKSFGDISLKTVVTPNRTYQF